ncbi:hypothetical protein CHU98_g3564 [Xylaria longipes]|nr:hypothetical protein CHU98_g3564 [Xylaria longipes]
MPPQYTLPGTRCSADEITRCLVIYLLCRRYRQITSAIECAVFGTMSLTFSHISADGFEEEARLKGGRNWSRMREAVSYSQVCLGPGLSLALSFSHYSAVGGKSDAIVPMGCLVNSVGLVALSALGSLKAHPRERRHQGVKETRLALRTLLRRLSPSSASAPASREGARIWPHGHQQLRVSLCPWKSCILCGTRPVWLLPDRDIHAESLVAAVYWDTDSMYDSLGIQGLTNVGSREEAVPAVSIITSIHSMSNLVKFEPHVDTAILFLFKRLAEVQAKSGRACDLSV